MADDRVLPKGCVELERIADKAGLSVPLGRALYVCNRLRHTWPRVKSRDIVSAGPTRRALTQLEVMQRVREPTALRWLAHWRRGGSIYTLKQTDEQYKRTQRMARDRQLSEGALMRRWIRRARRGAIEVIS